jgi:hypothetical protein
MIVIKKFIDKVSLKEFEPGDIYPPDGLNVTEERLAELSLKGYIKEKTEKVEKKEAKTEKKPAAKKTTKKSTKKE